MVSLLKFVFRLIPMRSNHFLKDVQGWESFSLLNKIVEESCVDDFGKNGIKDFLSRMAIIITQDFHSQETKN